MGFAASQTAAKVGTERGREGPSPPGEKVEAALLLPVTNRWHHVCVYIMYSVYIYIYIYISSSQDRLRRPWIENGLRRRRRASAATSGKSGILPERERENLNIQFKIINRTIICIYVYVYIYIYIYIYTTGGGGTGLPRADIAAKKVGAG